MRVVAGEVRTNSPVACLIQRPLYSSYHLSIFHSLTTYTQGLLAGSRDHGDGGGINYYGAAGKRRWVLGLVTIMCVVLG